MNKIQGAYSLIVMSPRKLIGARDPFGFRPLCIGKRENAYILASETCALETIGAEYVRDVEPGEIVTITPKEGIISDKSHCLPKEKEARCIFEYIYFARPDTHFDGVSVYQSRILAGKYLAMDSPVEADLVVGVPESGNAAAQGYAMQSGIPYGTAFVKNSYVGRTFIKPGQSSRESSVRVKLNVLRESSQPRVLSLIACNRSIEEIRQVIGADSLAYLKMERLGEMIGGMGHCTGCFTGNYPLDPPKEDIRGEHEK